jgi:hypothetical protein
VLDFSIDPHLVLLLIVANYEGRDGNDVVAADSPNVGALPQATVDICNYNATNRDCVPTGLFNFNKGDILNFTFGLSNGQRVRFYYAIIGGS